MRILGSHEDVLIKAMKSKQSQIRLKRCTGLLENIFKNALKKEPRLLAFLSGYHSSYMKTGLIQFFYNYDITIEYRENSPDTLEDVVVDTGDWEASSILAKGNPKEVVIVTSDSNAISTKITAELKKMLSLYEGFSGWSSMSYSFEKLSKQTAFYINYEYVVPLHELRQYQGKSLFAAKNIWKRILGKSKVPDFIKPFLAFSYLTQECCYDQRAFDEIESTPKGIPSDPVPHLAYGPLVESRGICSGLAWAFKTLMTEANIECICVSGYLKEDLKIGHIWNLVKIDGQYYHVDPTWGIKNNGVFISRMMQPDNVMKNSHIWEYEKYPQARGVRFDYDYIEDFLVENGNSYIDDGANEKYFFPEEIVE